jgi:phage N-6-adenine-methyltransferase
MNSLAQLSQASRMLAEASSLEDIQQIRGIAQMASEYAKAAKLGLEAQNTAAEIKIRAERKAGELLSKLKRDAPQQARITSKLGNDSPYRQALRDSDTSYQDANRWQQVALIPEIRFESFIDEAKENGQEITTNKAVQLAKRPHVTNNSGNNEWYTPKKYIQAVYDVLGTIELDPASSQMANEVIKANQIYTIEDDGLAHDWQGTVWLNPPYANNLIGQFTEKLCSHYGQGEVEEAIVLVNNATETAWFQEILGHSAAVCFPKSRIKYWGPDGEKNSPLQGQTFLYFGLDDRLFFDTFSAFGEVMIRYANV